MKNLSQFALGEIVEINQRQIALIETGKSFPSLKTLCALCNVFNCTLSDLFSFDINKNTAQIKKEMFSIIENIPESKLEAFYRFMIQVFQNKF